MGILVVCSLLALPAEEPIRFLWSRSDLVVVAVPAPEAERRVVLDVERVLKGTLEAKTLAVPRERGFVHAALPPLPAGKPLIVFLDRGRVAGTRVLAEDVRRRYLDRLAELPAVRTERDVTAWLVACMEDPATRREGAADFARADAPRPMGCVTQIDEAQWARLTKAFLAAPEVGEAEGRLAEAVLAARPDPRITEKLADILRSRLEAEDPLDALWALRGLAPRIGLERGLVGLFESGKTDRRAILRRALAAVP